jgi:hypothetical protein
MGYGFEIISFRLRSREVPNVEDSYENVEHPLGGGLMVDSWHSNKHEKKGGRGRQVVDTRHLGRIQPIIDLSCFGDSQRRSTRAQHSNLRSRELRVVIVFSLAYGYMYKVLVRREPYPYRI